MLEASIYAAYLKNDEELRARSDCGGPCRAHDPRVSGGLHGYSKVKKKAPFPLSHNLLPNEWKRGTQALLETTNNCVANCFRRERNNSKNSLQHTTHPI